MDSSRLNLSGFHAVLEIGLAIFLFLLWVVLQNYLWGGGCCGGYFAAFRKVGSGGGGSDYYYNMNDGVDGYAAM